MQMHVVPIQGIKPSTYMSVKRLSGHQAPNIIDQKLQGIKPPTYLSNGSKASSPQLE
jgi:hypothetical protein